jgi:class 3 adenylate cyclase
VLLCPNCGQETPEGFPRCANCGAPLGAASAREVRKTVTVLFCDMTGSTALGESTDPEALRGVLARYFERMKAIVERHGGTVEKFIGDAVMAVFGVPLAHEDDALRACRAALAMQDAFGELGIRGRIGVNSGEVVAGTGERLVTGDPVNVAARLEQAAQPGDVLIGEPTLVLVRSAVEVEPLEPLVLKGKAEPVPAFRLLTAAAGSERTHGLRFVGREQELALVSTHWERALSGPGCELVTVVGEAGVGKSRLVSEALALIDARVVSGRCLSYGEGITYWPVVEVLKQLGTVPSDPEAAISIRSLLGESDQGTSAEEIAWAFRKLLEEQAPLVVLFDDVQWGEETFLDLVDGVALLSSGASVLIVCMARPELLERRPSWPVTLRLEPLTADAVETLIGDDVSDGLRDRIAEAAGGNPLFVTEMLAMASETEAVDVPPSLRALLAVRLDQLEDAERRVLERGAIEGEVFHRGAVQALAPEELQVTPRLADLTRKQLISPTRPLLPGEDGFRFRHLLIRDAAYEALPKTVRAALHERFAAWLEDRGRALVELDEILGYHLEQAARYLEELGRPDATLALRAGEHLATAGRRAGWRDDDRAAAGLLARALGLTRALRLDVNLELDLAGAMGGDPQQAAAIAEQAANRAAAAGDATGEALARAVTALHRSQLKVISADEIEALALKALPLLEQAEDHAGLVHVWDVLGYGVANARTRYDDWVRAVEEALRHARLAGRPSSSSGFLGVALAHGPRPADEALATFERFDERPVPWSGLCRAWFLAMLGRFDEAWPLAEESSARLREQRGNWLGDWIVAEIAILAGDHELASRLLKEVCDWQEARGHVGHLSTYAPALGRQLCTLGRYEEAEEMARRGHAVAEEHDIGAQAFWRQVQARVSASRRQHAEAYRLAREAVEMLEQTDGLQAQGDALCDLAEVLDAAGRHDEAAAALHQALERYDRKRLSPLAARLRDQLAALQATEA